MMPADLPPLPIEPPAIVRSMDAEQAGMQRAEAALLAVRSIIFDPALCNMVEAVLRQMRSHWAPELMCDDCADRLLARLNGFDTARMFPDPPRAEMIVLAGALLLAAEALR